MAVCQAACLAGQGVPHPSHRAYRITIPEEIDGFALLEDVARARGMLLSGGVPNTERAAIAVLDEFRAGKLGRITLELPEEQA